MYSVSSDFIEYCKRHQRFFKEATITYEDDNGDTQTITSSNIIKIEISATPYVDYQIIGQAPSKKIHINLYGTDYDLIDREIQVTTTMIFDDDTTETLNLGTYIVSSDYESTVKDQCSFTGYDYMIKFDSEYDDSNLTYPCTLQDVLNDMCDTLDIDLYSTNIVNGGLEVTGNNFEDSTTNREVLQQIAQCAGTFAYIDRSNALHIDNFARIGRTGGTILQFPLQGTLQYDDDTTDSNYVDELTPSYYMQDFKQSREYGPVNCIRITMTDVDDAVEKKDTSSISSNGIQTITINDNYFLGTEDARQYAITRLWNALYNMRYTPMSCTYLGFPYLEMGDFIELELPDGTTKQTFVFNYTFTYNGGYMGTLETPTISRTQETYPSTTIDSQVRKIGVSVDRANASITAVVEDVDDVKAELTLKLDKDDNDQVISMINASADVITLDSNRLIINSTYFTLDENGYITATGGDIGGFEINSDSLTKEVEGLYNFDAYDPFWAGMDIMGEASLPSDYIDILDVNNDGSITAADYVKINNIISGTTTNTKTASGTFEINAEDPKNCLVVKDSSDEVVIGIGLGGISGQMAMFNNLLIAEQGQSYASAPYVAINGSTGDTKSTGSLVLYDERIKMGYVSSSSIDGGIVLVGTDYADKIILDGETGAITCVSLTQTSKAEEKKDFEKYEGALEEIDNIDIYKYRMKNEDGKKHIGFVIGDDFNYSEEVTSKNNDGVDIYSFVSLCCQAIKELKKEIEDGKTN